MSQQNKRQLFVAEAATIKQQVNWWRHPHDNGGGLPAQARIPETKPREPR